MSEADWEGSDLLAALRHSAATLRRHVDEVNALNVFPVPDGDTGSNMLATLQAAVDEGAAALNGNGELAHVANAISLGALMGARGNSGVILSQLFRGVSEALQTSQALDGRLLAGALQAGCTAAFAAVARPVEGTILTVARDAADGASRAARRERALEPVLLAAVEAAAASVERTPTLLPVLRQAEVVDAGGRGLELVLRGVLAHARGEELSSHAVEPAALVFPAFDVLADEDFGYETVFVLTPEEGNRLDVPAIRSRLEQLGQSVLVAGDERAVKVHVHNERPDEIIAFGLSLGTLSSIIVENMDLQARQRRRERERVVPTVASTPTAPATADAPVGIGQQKAAPAAAPPAAGAPPAAAPPAAPSADDAGAPATETAASAADTAPPAAPASALAVVAVAPGDGFEQLLRTLGASQVVRGENGANASAGELAQAIRATGCRDVLVLPNNANVRLAASQGGALCEGQNVKVVPTRNAAEGVAALLALDESARLSENAAQMSKTARSIQTLQVAEAVRDARLGRRRVRRGQHIVLRGDGKLLAADAERETAVVKAVQGLKQRPELITLYRGAGVAEEEATALAGRLREALPAAEIELIDGGQEHYSYLLSVE